MPELDSTLSDQPRRRRGLLALAAAAAVLLTTGILVSCGSETELDPVAAPPSPASTPADDPVRGIPQPVVTTEPPLTDPAPDPILDATGTLYSLQIPALDVRAPVVGIRMSDDLVLSPPRDPDVIGWWSQGVAPGEAVGTAVLVGHTVHSGGGALDDIDSLATGDGVAVADRDFRVTDVQVLSKDDLARRAGELFDQSSEGRLVLITCEDWDGTAFRSNVVVTAVPA